MLVAPGALTHGEWRRGSGGPGTHVPGPRGQPASICRMPPRGGARVSATPGSREGWVANGRWVCWVSHPSLVKAQPVTWAMLRWNKVAPVYHWLAVHRQTGRALLGPGPRVARPSCPRPPRGARPSGHPAVAEPDADSRACSPGCCRHQSVACCRTVPLAGPVCAAGK